MSPADLPPDPSLQVDKTERAQEKVPGLVSVFSWLPPETVPSHSKYILTVCVSVIHNPPEYLWNKGSVEQSLCLGICSLTSC